MTADEKSKILNEIILPGDPFSGPHIVTTFIKGISDGSPHLKTWFHTKYISETQCKCGTKTVDHAGAICISIKQKEHLVLSGEVIEQAFHAHNLTCNVCMTKLSINNMVTNCPKILTVVIMNESRMKTTVKQYINYFGQLYKPFYMQRQTGSSVDSRHIGHFTSVVNADGTWLDCNDSTLKALEKFPAESNFYCLVAYVALEEVNFSLAAPMNVTVNGELTSRSASLQRSQPSQQPVPLPGTSWIERARQMVQRSMSRTSSALGGYLSPE